MDFIVFWSLKPGLRAFPGSKPFGKIVHKVTISPQMSEVADDAFYCLVATATRNSGTTKLCFERSERTLFDAWRTAAAVAHARAFQEFRSAPPPTPF